jgi:hypothetical protein
VSCLTPSALHLGAIRGRLPGRDASAQTLIACVPCRNRPPTRLRARNLAYICTAQVAVGQNIDHTPSRPGAGSHPRVTCVSRHIKLSRPYPRIIIAPGVYARDLGSKVDVPPPQSSPSPRTRRRRGLRVGTHPHLRRRARKEGSVRRCALQPPPRWTAVPRLVLPRAWPAHLGSPLGSRSRPWHAPVLGVPGRCAPHIPPRHASFSGWRAIYPPTPVGRYSSPAPPRQAPDAWRRLGAQPQTHGFPTACFSPEYAFIRASGSVSLHACLSPACVWRMNHTALRS